MLRKIILAVALLVGAFAITQGPSQAMPLGTSAGAQSAAPAQVEAVRYYYYRRYRPRRFIYRRYYRPRYRYYRPRYYRPRYYY